MNCIFYVFEIITEPTGIFNSVVVKHLITSYLTFFLLLVVYISFNLPSSEDHWFL